MKKTIIIAAISLFSFAAIAQGSPKWATENGYWVVETNMHMPKSNIVYFYNLKNELVYKEKIDGMVIKVNKRKVKMNLKKVLEQSLVAYEAKHKSMENEMLVATLIKK
ncbi:MAG: hypothetical protein QM726_15980 [Chitinophagaceae bacterium]